MAADVHANFATSLIAVAPSPATSGTTATVTTGEGAVFPTPPFNAVVCPTATAPKAANAEIIRVTAIVGDVLTIVRTQEGTSARTIIVGDQIFAAITKKTLTDIEAAPGYVIPASWGTNWFTKFAAADASHQAVVAFVGDSITEGYDSSNFESTSYFALVRAALQTGTGKDGGSGYVSTVRSVVADANITSWTGATKISSSGAWSGQLGSGPADQLLYSNTNGNTLTFVVRGTVVKTFYARATTCGHFSISIDGGGAIDVNANNATSDLQVNTQSGLSSGSHTVVITNTTGGASGYSTIFGVSGEMAGGVLCHNFGHTGLGAGSYSNQAATTYGAIGQWSGGSKLPADLIIYALGVNDAAAATAASAWSAAVRTYLDDVRENNPNTDIVLLMPHIGKWETGASKVWQDYISRAAGMARSYGAALVDIWGLYRNSWANFNTASGWSNGHTGTGASGTDSIHPSNTGHQLYANALINLIKTGAP